MRDAIFAKKLLQHDKMIFFFLERKSQMLFQPQEIIQSTKNSPKINALQFWWASLWMGSATIAGKPKLNKKKKHDQIVICNSNMIVEIYDNGFIAIQTMKQFNFRRAIMNFLLAEESLVLVCSSLGQSQQQIGQWCIDKNSSLSSLGGKKMVFLQV